MVARYRAGAASSAVLQTGRTHHPIALEVTLSMKAKWRWVVLVCLAGPMACLELKAARALDDE